MSGPACAEVLDRSGIGRQSGLSVALNETISAPKLVEVRYFPLSRLRLRS